MSASPAFREDWLFRVVVAAALAYLAVVQVKSVRLESCTADEPLELAAGYSYLRTGDFRLNPEHPPLAKMLAALPLLYFKPSLPLESGAWSKADEGAFGAEFFRVNSRKADQILFAARLVAILETACLGIAIALWTRSEFGVGAAMLAIVLYAFDPTVIAYGRYLKNDIAITLFSFLACIAWGAFLGRRVLSRLCLAALALGCALATKFSALFLLPVFVILCFVQRWRNPERVSGRRDAMELAAVFLLAACVVALLYAAPSFGRARLGGIDWRVFRELVDRDRVDAIGRMVAHGVPRVHPYFEGLLVYFDHNTIGHIGYLLGKQSMTGWWYYFPVAFAVKTPVSTLALLGVAGCALQRGIIRGKWTPAERIKLLVLIVPIAVYCMFSAASRIDIGIRHLLPVWPFLFILGSEIWTGLRFRFRGALLALLCAGLAIESLRIYPDYLAFFNFLAGGPSHGPAILLDSNIDWGQDARKLRAWTDAHPAPRLCLDYWGAADLAGLGLSGPPLPPSDDISGRNSLDCIGAISVNRLYDLAADVRTHAWLRELRPRARIGYSIYIYDLRKDR